MPSASGAETEPAHDVRRARAALELVHDPRVAAIKFAHPAGDVAQAELARQCKAVWRHVRRLVERHYDVDATQPFWAVHRPGDPLNCLALTRDPQAARNVAEWWAGPNVAAVTRVEPDQAHRYMAMAVALHWKAPPWLTRQ